MTGGRPVQVVWIFRFCTPRGWNKCQIFKKPFLSSLNHTSVSCIDRLQLFLNFSRMTSLCFLIFSESQLVFLIKVFLIGYTECKNRLSDTESLTQVALEAYISVVNAVNASCTLKGICNIWKNPNWICSQSCS